MLELLSRLSYLLRHFRILLGNLVHSRDGAIDLFDAGMLLAARRVDLGHDVAELRYRSDRFVHARVGANGQLGAFVDAAYRSRDQIADLLRRCSRTLCEMPNLLCDDREALALLARTRRFDRRIQREQVRLESDAVDDSDDIGDALGGLADRAHGLRDLAHDRAGLLRELGRSDAAEDSVQEPLTEREIDELRLVAQGASNPQIAETLHITVNTVKVHLRNILAKLQLDNRTQSAAYAVQSGLVS